MEKIEAAKKLIESIDRVFEIEADIGWEGFEYLFGKDWAAIGQKFEFGKEQPIEKENVQIAQEVQVLNARISALACEAGLRDRGWDAGISFDSYRCEHRKHFKEYFSGWGPERKLPSFVWSVPGKLRILREEAIICQGKEAEAERIIDGAETKTKKAKGYQNYIQKSEAYWSSLRDIATQVDSIIISENAKGLFQKHIDNVFREAEKYRKYINAEYEKARKKGFLGDQPTRLSLKYFWHEKPTEEYFIPESAWLKVWLDDGDHGRNRERDEAFGAYIAERDKLDKDSDEYAEAYAEFKRSVMGDVEEYLVPVNDCDEMIVSFYMTRMPELDPLGYVFSMARGTTGKQHENLTLLDYQYFIIACNHDCQRYAAGQPPVYFDPQKVASSREEFVDFKDRICGKVTYILENVQYSFPLNDSRGVRAIQTVQLTMKLALQAVEADCTKNEDTKQEPAETERKTELVIEPTGKPQKSGPKAKYTSEKIQNMRTSYEKHFQEKNDVKYAWNCVAEEHNIKSGKAAEMAVRRYQKKNK